MIAKIDNYSDFNHPPYLLNQFQDTDVQKILEAMDRQFQDLETAAYDLFTKMWLDNAEGHQLDVLGKHIGFERLGRPDEMYRVMLYMKSRINTVSGSAEAIMETIRFLYGATEVHYTIDPPAKIVVRQNGAIALLFYFDIILDDGSFLVDDQGNQLIFAEPDNAAVAILDSVVPVGVKLTVNQI